MIRSYEEGTVYTESGSIVVLSKEDFDAIAFALNTESSDLMYEYNATEVDIGVKDRYVGVDTVYAVHNNGYVSESVIINAYPEHFKRFLQKTELTFAEFSNHHPDAPTYLDYLEGRRIVPDPRHNPVLDEALGIK